MIPREGQVLEPVLPGTLIGPDGELRTHRPIAQAPKRLIDAILASEDRDFRSHSGVSFTSLIRALWAVLGSEIAAWEKPRNEAKADRSTWLWNDSGMVRTLTLSSLVLLCACKSPADKYGERAAAHLNLLPALAGPARDAPEVDAASTKGLGTVTDLSLKYLDSNALLIHLEELDNPTVRLKLPLRLNQRSPGADVAAALRVVKPADPALIDAQYSTGLDSESNMKDAYTRMGQLKYVMVVRQKRLSRPEVASGKTFIGGAWNGEVLVFELESRRLLGGFALAGGSHATVNPRGGEVQANLNADLKLATRGNLNAAARQFIASVGPNDEAN